MEDKLELSDGSIWIMQDIKKVFQELYDHYRSIVNRNKWFQEENERLKSDAYKDEELAKMKFEYDRMREDYLRGFHISEAELKRINEWIDEQMKKHPGVGGAIGGRFRYEFIPTGVGTSGTIIDGFTDDRFNFQELG